jgi:hypothetical protein
MEKVVIESAGAAKRAFHEEKGESRRSVIMVLEI